MDEQQKTCEQLIDSRLKDRANDIRKYMEVDDIWEDAVEDLGLWESYGLCFDYVEANTFDNQEEGYFRYQLSWGGPSDEINFYRDGRVEYRYKDWFDGAVRELDTTEDWVQWLDDMLFLGEKESIFEEKELEECTM
tara:strand:+ start:1260 stop:1667 length:408 start_codon:yes stop_codon:yes gene_type:complete